MAKTIDYHQRWDETLEKACGEAPEILVKMDQLRFISACRKAFRDYLLQCYCDHVRNELGPALAPTENLGLLKLKVALVNQWKTSDFSYRDTGTIIDGLTGELSAFKLPEQACEVISHFGTWVQQHPFRNPHHKNVISEMVKHHRPAPPAD